MDFNVVSACLRHYLSAEPEVRRLIRKVMGDNWSLDRLLAECIAYDCTQAPENVELERTFREQVFTLPAPVTAVVEEWHCSVFAERDYEIAGHEPERLAILVQELFYMDQPTSTWTVTVMAYRVNSITWTPNLCVVATMDLVTGLMNADCQGPLLGVQPQFNDRFQHVFCNLAEPMLKLSWIATHHFNNGVVKRAVH